MSQPAAIDGPTGAARPGREKRVAALVLLRLAANPTSEPGGVPEREAIRDLAAYADRSGPSGGLAREVATAIGGLVTAGLAARVGKRLTATADGRRAAAGLLGLADPSQLGDWAEVRDHHLTTLALDLVGTAAARRKAALRVDGLRALVVEAAYGIEGSGRPSASRIRARLSVLALERAFGNAIKAGLGGKTALSAKASRLLAAQLAPKPRQHATDARLMTELAGAAVGTSRADLEHLRQGVVRRWLAAGTLRLETAAPGVRESATTPATAATPAIRLVSPAPVGATPASPASVPSASGTPGAAAPAARRPAPTEFAAAVKAAAAAKAEGWAGNRKAFVSHVWSLVRERHPGWGVSEIEFKAMLAEAHRLGLVVLANADLKDRRTLAEVEASAVSYKNTVWHYVRVEE